MILKSFNNFTDRKKNNVRSYLKIKQEQNS